MSNKKKKNKHDSGKLAAEDSTPHRNRPIRIPLSFDKAIEGLVNVKRKKPKADTKESSECSASVGSGLFSVGRQ